LKRRGAESTEEKEDSSGHHLFLVIVVGYPGDCPRVFLDIQGGKSSVAAERSREDVHLDEHEQQRHRQFLRLFAANEAAVHGFVRIRRLTQELNHPLIVS
jgi:hypothetical protein